MDMNSMLNYLFIEQIVYLPVIGIHKGNHDDGEIISSEQSNNVDARWTRYSTNILKNSKVTRIRKSIKDSGIQFLVRKWFCLNAPLCNDNTNGIIDIERGFRSDMFGQVVGGSGFLAIITQFKSDDLSSFICNWSFLIASGCVVLFQYLVIMAFENSYEAQ